MHGLIGRRACSTSGTDGEFGPLISAEWLDAALHRSGVLTSEVTLLEVNQDAMVVKSLEGCDREDGGGISGPKIVKLKLTYSEAAPADLPTNMILKWGSLTHFVRDELPVRVYLWLVEMNLGQMLRCEAGVYRQRDVLVKQGIKIPRAYYVGDVYPQTANGEPDDPGSCCFVCCGRRAAVRAVQLMEDASVDYEPGPIGWGDEVHGMTQDRVRCALQTNKQTNAGSLLREPQTSWDLMRFTIDAHVEGRAMMTNLVKLHAWGWADGIRKIPIEGLWETSPHIGRTVGRESLLLPSLLYSIAPPCLCRFCLVSLLFPFRCLDWLSTSLICRYYRSICGCRDASPNQRQGSVWEW